MCTLRYNNNINGFVVYCIKITICKLALKGHLKVKVKLSLCFFFTEHHAMKAYWGSEGIAPLFFDLGTRR
jgi:hypothetical protein